MFQVYVQLMKHSRELVLMLAGHMACVAWLMANINRKSAGYHAP